MSSPLIWGSLRDTVGKSPPDGAGDLRDSGLIPGSGRSPGGGNGNSHPYPCLENPMDRGAWLATVHGFAKSWTRLKHTEHRALQKNNPTKQEKTCKSQTKIVLWALLAFFGDHQCTQGLHLDLNTLIIKTINSEKSGKTSYLIKEIWTKKQQN